MSDVKWIKIQTDMFTKVGGSFDAIKSLPDAKDVELIWIKLLCLAGVCNAHGLLIINSEIPYTDEMLAKAFDYDIGIVQRALSVFQSLGMIEIVDKAYMVSNWTKYQSADKLDNIREKNKIRQQKYRDKQKQLAIAEKENDRNVTDDVTHNAEMTLQCSKSSSLSSISKNKKNNRFIKPTEDEVREYCLQNNYLWCDPIQFISYYEAVGWKVGKKQMESWKGAVAGWNHRHQKNGEQPVLKKLHKQQPTPEEEQEETEEEWLKRMESEK